MWCDKLCGHVSESDGLKKETEIQSLDKLDLLNLLRRA